MSVPHHRPNRAARLARTIRTSRHGQYLLCRRAESRTPLHVCHAGPEFAQVAVHLALQYPAARTIHLVVDNLNIHRRKSLTDLLGEQFGNEVGNCFTVHYTPTHGSWFNQAEIEIGLFSRQCLGKRQIPDLTKLKRETRAWNRRLNRARVRINWAFDRRAARRKFGYKWRSFKQFIDLGNLGQSRRHL